MKTNSKECHFCNKEIVFNSTYCNHCGKYVNSRMIDNLYKFLEKETFQNIEKKINKTNSLPFQDNKFIGEFWKLFVITYIKEICKLQRDMIQVHYEETMGVEYEDIPFDFVDFPNPYEMPCK